MTSCKTTTSSLTQEASNLQSRSLGTSTRTFVPVFVEALESKDLRMLSSGGCRHHHQDEDEDVATLSEESRCTTFLGKYLTEIVAILGKTINHGAVGERRTRSPLSRVRFLLQACRPRVHHQRWKSKPTVRAKRLTMEFFSGRR